MSLDRSQGLILKNVEGAFWCSGQVVAMCLDLGMRVVFSCQGTGKSTDANRIQLAHNHRPDDSHPSSSMVVVGHLDVHYENS